MIAPEGIIKELDELISEGKSKILPTKWYPEGVIGSSYYVDNALYAGWYRKVVTFVESFLPEDQPFLLTLKENKKGYFRCASENVEILESIKAYLSKGLISLSKDNKIEPEKALNIIFARFHKVVRQLRSRYEKRSTLEVEDEYDVQDLLHVLLCLYFNDIRPEEWTPSYAGKSARMDFLLKPEQIVIEVKKTRKGLEDKELGDQLIVDVERYQVHPNCKKLICFVYDPEGRIGNPVGLMKDLNERHEGFVEVVIEPA